jgi:signal transduction histidine kinase
MFKGIPGGITMASTPLRGEAPFAGGAVLDGAASKVVSDIHRFFSRERLERAATHDERTRLAHELHDGLLQSLTGIALQLQTVASLIESKPEAASQRLRDVQSLIAVEQQELRRWVEHLLDRKPAVAARGNDLTSALEQLCRRAEWHWGVRCELTADLPGSVPATLGDQIYRIVQEGLNNIGRHARAQIAHVNLHLNAGRVELWISDDGVGFPFRGEYDLAVLKARRLGPRSLKERISALNGTLVLTSNLSGSQLRIGLPLPHQTWPGPARPTLGRD